jgi:hypothetical protein
MEEKLGQDASMTRRILLAITALLASGTLLCLRSPASGAASYQASEVEAAFIYNFAKFVEWPEDAFDNADSPIVIGIVGDDPFGSTIDQIVDGKQLNGRHFVIRRMRWSDDFRHRQIVFMSGSDAGKARQLLDRLKGSPILMIAETPGLAQQGAVISFVTEQGRVRFEINLDAARRAHLTISSRLLSLAKSVIGSSGARG